MLSLTKINGKRILLNESLIEYVEEMPDTTVMLATGNVMIVKENLSVILEKSRSGGPDSTLLRAAKKQKNKKMQAAKDAAKKGGRRG